MVHYPEFANSPLSLKFLFQEVFITYQILTNTGQVPFIGNYILLSE